MNEIGGYLELDNFIKNEYYSELLGLNTGRNALKYLMKSRNIQKIHIPYFLCDSIRDWLIKHNYNIEFYSINEEFKPKFDRYLDSNEYILIVNYYGQLKNKEILEFKRKYNNIIIDNTQAFFQHPIKGIDTFYSCRKFFGVPDGAYLSTDTFIKGDLEVDKSFHRMIHILGRYEGEASDYYNSFQENDRSFKQESLKAMSRLTRNILGAIEYDRIMHIRSENFIYLDQGLRSKNKLNLKAPKVAFAYPFYCENGMEIRKKLAEKKIYIPTLWPNILQDMPEESIEYQYALNILPLPCDQRYGKDDMNDLIEEILRR